MNDVGVLCVQRKHREPQQLHCHARTPPASHCTTSMLDRRRFLRSKSMLMRATATPTHPHSVSVHWNTPFTECCSELNPSISAHGAVSTSYTDGTSSQRLREIAKLLTRNFLRCSFDPTDRPRRQTMVPGRCRWKVLVP